MQFREHFGFLRFPRALVVSLEVAFQLIGLNHQHLLVVHRQFDERTLKAKLVMAVGNTFLIFATMSRPFSGFCSRISKSTRVMISAICRTAATSMPIPGCRCWHTCKIPISGLCSHSSAPHSVYAILEEFCDEVVPLHAAMLQLLHPRGH